MTEWTQDDQRLALDEGWGLFWVDGRYPNIQRHDEAEIFTSDWAARTHVAAASRSGHALAQKAWAVITEFPWHA